VAVNPVDFKMMRESVPNFIRPMPKIPGSDLSGVVVAADEGSRFKAGDRVFAMAPTIRQVWGSAAQFISLYVDYSPATARACARVCAFYLYI